MPITISSVIVLAPVLILGAVIGSRRGYKDEGWTLAALLITVGFVSRPGVLLPVLERIISVFLRAGKELLGRDATGPSFSFPPDSRRWALVLSFFVLVALAYFAGHLLGKGEQGKGLYLLLACLLGGVNAVIVAVWLATQLLARDGEDFARITLPSFQGRDVILGTPTANSVLGSWPGLLGLLFVIILLIVLLKRARVLR